MFTRVYIDRNAKREELNVKISEDLVVRSRAPLRISFAGGGTELLPFIKNYGGVVISASISRYAYTTVRWLPGSKETRFLALDLGKETQMRHKNNVPEKQGALDSGLQLHEAVLSEFISRYEIKLQIPIEISTYSDAPAGSGLGSSSTLTVSIIKALALFFGIPLKEDEVAKFAYYVERNKLGFAGGLQDHYSAIYGGLNYINFLKNGKVIINQLRLSTAQRAEFESWLLMIYSGLSRNSGEVIEKQIKQIEDGDTKTIERLLKIKLFAKQIKNLIMTEDFEGVGKLMHESWLEKRSITNQISNSSIDKLYETARDYGALGGKLSGAGGGGYLLLMCSPERKPNLFSQISKEGTYRAENVYLSNENAIAWKI
jgi:D-glycero-alpha-D-manno-heptose-7-phosphate kinase